MSENFLRVKNTMLREMKETNFHTAESWANIMLQNTQYLTTVEDQKSFYNWILNPSDSREYQAPTFKKHNPDQILCEEFGKLTLVNKDDEKECEQTYEVTQQGTRNGMTQYITVESVLHE